MKEEDFKRTDDKYIHFTLNSRYERTPELEGMLADIAIQVMSVCNVLQDEIDKHLEEITHPGGHNLEKMELEPKVLKFLVNDAVGLVLDTFRQGFGFEAYTHDKKMAKLIADKIDNGRKEHEENNSQSDEA